MLIGHRSWLGRRDFVGEFVEIFDGTASGAPMVSVDWLAALAALDAGELQCSSSEDQILRIAVSLAEGVPVDLRASVCGLDVTNGVLCAEAVLHAAGHRRSVAEHAR